MLHSCLVLTKSVDQEATYSCRIFFTDSAPAWVWHTLVDSKQDAMHNQKKLAHVVPFFIPGPQVQCSHADFLYIPPRFGQVWLPRSTSIVPHGSVMRLCPEKIQSKQEPVKTTTVFLNKMITCEIVVCVQITHTLTHTQDSLDLDKTSDRRPCQEHYIYIYM